MKPEITHRGLLGMQVCVPSDWDDDQVENFANTYNPTGIESRWGIRKEGHKYLNGDSERVPCSDRVGFVHIMLDC